jgi:DNA-binding transcriptional MerR regulator
MSRPQSELFPWEESEAAGPSREEAGTDPAETDTGAAASQEPADATDAHGPNDEAAAATEEPIDTGTDGEAQEETERGDGEDDATLAALEPWLERVPGRERLIAPKEYYSISEVCELVGLKPHVLRYWETQFPVLNPSKNRSGNRVYQRKEIRLVLLVKHLLYEEKYTVEGAKQRIEQMRKGGDLRDATARALSEEALTLLKDDLRQLLRILNPSGDS